MSKYKYPSIQDVVAAELPRNLARFRAAVQKAKDCGMSRFSYLTVVRWRWLVFNWLWRPDLRDRAHNEIAHAIVKDVWDEIVTDDCVNPISVTYDGTIRVSLPTA